MAHAPDTPPRSSRPDQTFADDFADKAREQFDRLGQKAADTMDTAREVGAKAQDMARQFRPVIEQSLKDQPMTTLAGAAVLGFLLGALWKR